MTVLRSLADDGRLQLRVRQGGPALGLGLVELLVGLDAKDLELLQHRSGPGAARAR